MKEELKKEIYKDWDCVCEGESSDHTYSRSTKEFAEYVISKLDQKLKEKEERIRREIEKKRKNKMVHYKTATKHIAYNGAIEGVLTLPSLNEHNKGRIINKKYGAVITPEEVGRFREQTDHGDFK